MSAHVNSLFARGLSREFGQRVDFSWFSHFPDKEIAIFRPKKATFSDKPSQEFHGAY
jgi:hypothetical protein